MCADPTGIKIAFDPTVQRMTGVTAHGFVPFDVPFISEITPGLWQGGCRNGLMLPKFIRHVVSLYPWESYKVKHELASTFTIRAHDSLDQATDQVDAIAAWVNIARESGAVLVHCQAGLNRSSLVVGRALMLGGMTGTAAVALLREKRSPACLCNRGFLDWLLGCDKPGGGRRPGDRTRVYAPRGRLAHLLGHDELPSAGRPSALCLLYPRSGASWLGTGSQGEYEKAASLPLCGRCEAVAKGAAA